MSQHNYAMLLSKPLLCTGVTPSRQVASMDIDCVCFCGCVRAPHMQMQTHTHKHGCGCGLPTDAFQDLNWMCVRCRAADDERPHPRRRQTAQHQHKHTASSAHAMATAHTVFRRAISAFVRQTPQFTATTEKQHIREHTRALDTRTHTRAQIHKHARARATTTTRVGFLRIARQRRRWLQRAFACIPLGLERAR